MHPNHIGTCANNEERLNTVKFGCQGHNERINKSFLSQCLQIQIQTRKHVKNITLVIKFYDILCDLDLQAMTRTRHTILL